MRRGAIRRVAAVAASAALLVGALPEPALARSKTRWRPVTATEWYHGAGGDSFQTGYNPTEKRPRFIAGGKLDTGDADGPWLEWATRLSDLPSGVWPLAGIVVSEGLVIVAGGATNSVVALDADTGLPVWRFQPDPRSDGSTSAYPASNAPVIHDGIFYVTFSSGWLYALSVKTGRKIWSYRATDANGNPDFYRDLSDRTTPDNDAEKADSPYRPESWVENRDPLGPVHPGVEYPKIHGRTSICENTVVFMTLSGYVHGVDAKTGKRKWRVYGDGPEYPGELVWPEFKQGGVQRSFNSAAGMSTRRFEAVPGPGCLHGEVQVPGSDGHVRFLDPQTGKSKAQGGDVGVEFDRTDGATDFCAAAGWNCDFAVGIADPQSGDYLITTLDARLMRLDWRTHEPEWRRTYQAPLPFEQSGGMPLTLEHLEHGFIAQAVTGGLQAFDVERRIMWAANQDGHLYGLAIPEEGANDAAQSESCPDGYTNIRPEAATPATAVPCLVARVGMSPNADEETPYTRKGEGGPWDYDSHALSGLVLGGDVLYVAPWNNKIYGYDVRNPASPKRVWEHEFTWDERFQFPPFGDTYDEPFADIDLKVMSSPALVGGRLYVAANDGHVYAFNLHRKVKTVRNLAILGSGAVPFLPEWKDRIGAYDRVWTPEDWYKNQVAPAGYRFPKAAGTVTATGLILSVAGAWWYVRRREDLLAEIEEMLE